MTEPIRFVVYGTPVPQGSMRAFAMKGRGARVVQGGSKDRRQKLGDWRQAIAAEARKHQAADPTPLIEGPVCLTVSFLLPKPKSAPKWKRWVSTKPDLDKLLRAVLDALTGTLLVDDAQVVNVSAGKSYAIDCPPHADVMVFPVAHRERELSGDPPPAPSDQPALT